MINKTIHIIFTLVVLFVIIENLNAGTTYRDDSLTRNNNRLKLIIASEAGLTTTSVVMLYNLWYKDYPSTSFHFYNDNNEWLSMDKIGHATTSYCAADLNFSLYKWAGLEYNKALWYSVSVGLAFQTSIEIMDGFAKNWGFSPGDMMANITGAALFVGQQYYWKEQRIKLKWSFYKTSFAQYRPELLGKNLSENLIKDYNGQTYWLSLNINSFLKKESYLPNWLNIAVGYGADGMLGGRENPTNIAYIPPYQRSRQFYLSLDIDPGRIKTKSTLLRTIFKAVSFIKVPMPTLEFNASKNSMKGYFLFF